MTFVFDPINNYDNTKIELNKMVSKMISLYPTGDYPYPLKDLVFSSNTRDTDMIQYECKMTNYYLCVCFYVGLDQVKIAIENKVYIIDFVNFIQIDTDTNKKRCILFRPRQGIPDKLENDKFWIYREDGSSEFTECNETSFQLNHWPKTRSTEHIIPFGTYNRQRNYVIILHESHTCGVQVNIKTHKTYNVYTIESEFTRITESLLKKSISNDANLSEKEHKATKEIDTILHLFYYSAHYHTNVYMLREYPVQLIDTIPVIYLNSDQEPESSEKLEGYMKVYRMSYSIPGCKNCLTICIKFHLKCVSRSIEFTKYTYLPDDEKGNTILSLIRLVWSKNLLFTICDNNIITSVPFKYSPDNIFEFDNVTNINPKLNIYFILLETQLSILLL